MVYKHTCYNYKLEFVSNNKVQFFCSRSCAAKARRNSQPIDKKTNNSCKKCGEKIISKKIGQEFCNRSCANSFNVSARKVKDKSIFFEGLNSNNSYILGLIWSDGCLSYDRHSHRFRITISMNDEDIMKKIHSLICPDKKFYIYKHPNGREKTYTVISFNEYDINFISELGICERKSNKIRIPELPEHLLPHFVRGIFDGDGSVYISVRTKKHTYLGMSITTGSNLFASELQSLFLSKGWKATIVTDSRSKNSTHPTYYVKLNRQADISEFKNWIYQETNLYLKRKYVKFYGDDIV